MKINNLLLNGFDRCGSSVIATALATHPQTEVLYHPFNSGSIRHKMYQIMTDDIASAEDVRFFMGLENEQLWKDYIISPWFKEYSTTLDFIPGKLHVLKTTLNHLTIRWIHERFPRIETWGIWRDPFDILASLVRNAFYAQWYTDALPQVITTLKISGEFPPLFNDCLRDIGDSEVKALALLIATRSYFFFRYLERDKLINYEHFKTDPNSELNKISNYFEIERYSIDARMDEDHNIVGLDYEMGKSHRHLINKEEYLFATKLFLPIFDLMEKRFGEGPWRNADCQEGLPGP